MIEDVYRQKMGKNEFTSLDILGYLSVDTGKILLIITHCEHTRSTGSALLPFWFFLHRMQRYE